MQYLMQPVAWLVLLVLGAVLLFKTLKGVAKWVFSSIPLILFIVLLYYLVF